MAELTARIRAMLRRGLRTPVSVDLPNRVVTRDGAPVNFTPVEFRLLSHLVTHPGKVLTHRQLLHEVWGPSHTEHAHYLRTYMAHLRRKLEADPARPRHLLTETGVGYRFVS